MRTWEPYGKFGEFKFKAILGENEVFLYMWKEPTDGKRVKFCITHDGPLLTEDPLPMRLEKTEFESLLEALNSPKQKGELHGQKNPPS